MLLETPSTVMGTARDWATSNRLQSNVWFLWEQKLSKWARINRIGLLEESPVFRDASRNERCSAKDPNTLLPTTFSRLSCLVMSLSANLSSSWIWPDNLTTTTLSLQLSTAAALVRTWVTRADLPTPRGPSTNRELLSPFSTVLLNISSK